MLGCKALRVETVVFAHLFVQFLILLPTHLIFLEQVRSLSTFDASITTQSLLLLEVRLEVLDLLFLPFYLVLYVCEQVLASL